LHAAGQADGAQDYPQCVNLNIKGSGTKKPTGVALVGLYAPTDPGILFNLYTSFTSYLIPGPAVYVSS
jgi:cellulase